MELFWKKGYNGTSMADLVEYLGISRASLYSSYPKGKKDLFDKALQHYKNINTQYISELLESIKSYKERIVRIFDMTLTQSIEDIERKGCFMVNATTELAALDETVQQISLNNSKHFRQLFLDLLSQAKDAGEISQAIELKPTADYLFTLHVGLRVLAKTDPTEATLKQVLQTGLAILDS